MVVVRLDESAASVTTHVRRGDTVELALAENPTTGYRWRARQPAGLLPATSSFAEGKSGAPGDGGLRRLAFDVVKAGRHQLLVELARPWETTARRSMVFIVQASEAS